MLFGSEVWCLGQNELDIFKKTERARVRVILGLSYQIGFKSKSLINRLGLKETLETLIEASSVRWFGHLMKNKGNVLRKALTQN